MLPREKCGVFGMLWNVKVILKAHCLSWRVMLDKLPRKDKLLVKGVQLQNNLCNLCLAREKSVTHLFFTCRIAQSVCNMCDRWMGVTSVHHSQPTTNF